MCVCVKTCLTPVYTHPIHTYILFLNLYWRNIYPDGNFSMLILPDHLTGKTVCCSCVRNMFQSSKLKQNVGTVILLNIYFRSICLLELENTH